MTENTGKYLAMDYEELKARKEALQEAILGNDPQRDVVASHIIYDERIPILSEMDNALAILRQARRKLGKPV